MFSVTEFVVPIDIGMGVMAPLYIDPPRAAHLMAPMEVGVPSLSATQYSDPPESTLMTVRWASVIANFTELLETP
jgi:hypothetical protein